MNKSHIFRNKLYRFCFLLLSFFLFVYLINFLITGTRGIISYNQIIKKHSLLIEKRNILKKINDNLEDKISRLSTQFLDEDYLDEQLRLKTGKTYTNEIVIKLDN